MCNMGLNRKTADIHDLRLYERSVLSVVKCANTHQDLAHRQSGLWSKRRQARTATKYIVIIIIENIKTQVKTATTKT